MQNNKFFKIMTTALACIMTFACVACETSDVNQPSVTNKADANIKFAYAEDKIYQTYDRVVNGVQDYVLAKQGEEYMAKLMDSFSLSAFRNETESRQMIITAETDVADYNVTVSDFKNGENVLPASAFELGHEYYHNMTTTADPNTPMTPGMVPDAIIPLEYAALNDLNKIKKGENQGVFITVNVPKEQPAGVYTGTFTVQLDATVKEVTGTVTVLDYTLPDEAVARSCMVVNGMDTDFLQYLELDSSQESYWKYVEKLGEFRLSAQYMYGMKISADTVEEVEVLAEEHVKYMLKAAVNPKINTYSIRTNGKWAPINGVLNITLNEDWFMVYTKAMVEASLKEGVDLFKKATVYMGSIIDEPEGTDGMDRVDYVCEQFHDCLRRTVSYLNEIKNTAEKAENVDEAFIESMIASILKVTNVVTSSSVPDTFKQIDTYCPKIATPYGRYPEPVGSSARLEDYADLENETTSNGRTKDYWWYSHQTPYYPNPTLHIDDNGVSARVMYWMMSEYNIQGYLIWETVMVESGDTSWGQGSILHGWEQYEDISRDGGSSIGDAFMFYPGKLLGMDTPVPAVRLYYMRDGIEDYDAMYDLRENLYASLSEKYGATLNVDGILNELYASMYTLNKTYATSSDVASARKGLESLLVWANNGIGVSDFTLKADGTATAKIYAPANVQIKVNGKVLTGGQASGEGVVYTVSEKAENFIIEAAGMSVNVFTKTTEIFSADTQKVTLYTVVDNKEVVDQTAAVSVNNGAIAVGLKATNTELNYALTKTQLTSDSKSLIIVVDYSGTERTEMSIGFKALGVNGVATRGVLDTVYLHPGENVIRIDRIGDLRWDLIKEMRALTFAPQDGHSDYTLTFKNISVIG